MGVDLYLEGVCAKFLERLATTEDSLSRILARFRTPTRSQPHSIEAFTRRITDEIDAPIDAYRHEHSRMPPAASRSLFGLSRLIGSGSFIDTVGHHRV